MTKDEELAKEWAKNNGSTCLHANMSAYIFAEHAFLAGLKEGREQVQKQMRSELGAA